VVDCLLVEEAEMPTIGVRSVVALDAMTDFFGAAYGQVFERIGREGLTVTGMPFGRYRGMPTETVDIEAGVTVAETVPSSGEIVAGTLPATKAVEAVHVGPYDTMVETYAAMQDWIGSEGLEPSDEMWEFYLTGPTEEPDPAKWQTKIIWPIV